MFGLTKREQRWKAGTKIMEDLKHLREVLTEVYPREELDLEALARVVALLSGLPPAALDGMCYCPVLPRKRKPLKLPKYTMAPSRDWTESAGLLRAVAVLKTEAAILRREGFDLQPKALMRVAAALTEANRRESTTGEAYALDWVRRDEATASSEDA